MIIQKVCLKCGSSNINGISKGVSMTFKCRNCGFVGNMVEKPVVSRDKFIGGRK